MKKFLAYLMVFTMLFTVAVPVCAFAKDGNTTNEGGTTTDDKKDDENKELAEGMIKLAEAIMKRNKELMDSLTKLTKNPDGCGCEENEKTPTVSVRKNETK